MLAVTEECDGGRGGESPGRSWSRSDERRGGKRLSQRSAASERGTRGSGDSGLLLWWARGKRDMGLLRDVIVVVLLDDD